MASTPIGLDTIHLTLPVSEARIAPGFEWQKMSGDTQRPERNLFLYSDTAGGWERGTNAYLNTPDWGLDLGPGGGGIGLLLRFSAGAYSGDNFLPLDLDRLRSVWACVDGELRDRGLEADWMQAKVARSDVTRRLDLSRLVPNYINLWQSLAFPPGVVAEFPRGTSFRLNLSTARNCLAQWEQYDKGREMQGKAGKRRPKASNLMGSELRLKGEAAADALGVPATLKELMRPRTFKVLPDFYRASACDKLLPMLDLDRAPTSADDLASRLAADLEELATSSKLAACKSRACDVVLLRVHGFVGACDFYERNYFPACASDTKKKAQSKRAALSREKKRLRALWNELEGARPAPSGAPRSHLARELRAAVTA